MDEYKYIYVVENDVRTGAPVLLAKKVLKRGAGTGTVIRRLRCWLGWHHPLTIIGEKFVWECCEWCNKPLGHTRRRIR